MPTASSETLRFYRHKNSNIHLGAHVLAARATDAYEQARSVVTRFLHAGRSVEIVLITLVHHANIVPWLQLVHETGAKLRVAPVDDSSQVILEEYERLFSSRTRLAAFSQVSNALGTITPIESMIAIAHRPSP